MGDDGDTAWILEDDECGQFAVASEDEVQREVARHFLFQHERMGVLIEGRDWRRITLPLRCDMCGTAAELPWWKHVATPRLVEADDRDGVWLVCAPCHELVKREDVDGLLERAWAQSKRASPWIARSPAASHIRSSLRQMMQQAVQRFDAGTLETL